MIYALSKRHSGPPIVWFIFRRAFSDGRRAVDTIEADSHEGTMPPKLWVEYPGTMYHAMNWGDRREEVFLDDVDLNGSPIMSGARRMLFPSAPFASLCRNPHASPTAAN